MVVKVQAPPAAVLMQEPQRQMPTARPFILVLPQKEQVCLARWRFHFLHHFPEGGTITGPVFAHDSSLVGVSCQVAAT